MQGVLRNCRCLARLSRTPVANSASKRIISTQLQRYQTISTVITNRSRSLTRLNARFYSNDTEIDAVTFDKVCEETLESLCDYFEELVEGCTHLKGADVTFGDGVLTVQFGSNYGTYVINRQTPNKQIWLSSPTSGPKRYDFVSSGDGHWVYKHDGIPLHRLLQEEIPKIVQCETDFSQCLHSLL